MEELNLLITPAAARQEKLGHWLKLWRLGQQMQARVIDMSPRGKLLLDISGHKITAITDAPVEKGALLRLQVNSLYPAPGMKIIHAPLPGAAPPSPLETQIQLLLPRQGSVTAPLVALLDQSQRVNILSVLGVKNDALQRLENNLSRFELLADLKILQKAMQQSGLFLESELLRLVQSGGVVPRGDLKAILLRLLARINKTRGAASATGGDPAARAMLSKLHAQTEGAIAAIALNQLAAIRQQDPQGHIWVFDMPFRIQDSLHGLRISVGYGGAAAQDPPPQREWKVLLDLNLPGLGPIEAELFMRGSKVSVVVYAQWPKTAQLLEAGLPFLHNGLANRGLVVSVLRCHLGARSEDKMSASWRQCVDVQI